MSEMIPANMRQVTVPEAGMTNLLAREYADVAVGEDARLDFEARLSYRFPVTMTEKEVRDEFIQLISRLGAITQCHLIIDSVPLGVIPTILPQLREMAEYESRMWHVRRELSGPDIRERWISLPITA